MNNKEFKKATKLVNELFTVTDRDHEITIWDETDKKFYTKEEYRVIIVNRIE